MSKVRGFFRADRSLADDSMAMPRVGPGRHVDRDLPVTSRPAEGRDDAHSGPDRYTEEVVGGPGFEPGDSRSRIQIRLSIVIY